MSSPSVLTTDVQPTARICNSSESVENRVAAPTVHSAVATPRACGEPLEGDFVDASLIVDASVDVRRCDACSGQLWIPNGADPPEKIASQSLAGGLKSMRQPGSATPPTLSPRGAPRRPVLATLISPLGIDRDAAAEAKTGRKHDPVCDWSPAPSQCEMPV